MLHIALVFTRTESGHKFLAKKDHTKGGESGESQPLHYRLLYTGHNQNSREQGSAAQEQHKKGSEHHVGDHHDQARDAPDGWLTHDLAGGLLGAF